jgi:hypothetical protein
MGFQTGGGGGGGSGLPILEQLPDGTNTCDIIKWNDATGEWEVGAFVDCIPAIVPAAATTILTLTAGENILLGRACVMETDGLVYHFDKTDLTHVNKYIGMSIQNILVTQDGQIQTDGLMVVSGFTYTAGPQWVIGTAGQIGATPPSGADDVSMKIGVAFNNFNLIIEPMKPILLSS